VLQCPSNILKKIKVKLTRNAFPVLGTSYTGCIGGCDAMFSNMMGVITHTVRRIQGVNDTGYGSNISLSGNSSNASARRGQQSSRNSDAAPPSSSSIAGVPSAPRNNGTRGPSAPRNNTTGGPFAPRNNGANLSSATRDTRTPSTSSSAFNYGWSNDNNTEIVCNCHEPAKELVVRKEGPNQG
jgi:hypothetical protein